VVGGVVAFISLLIGLGPLNDNSFLTHLATGRLMWATHHIPHSDPYTFTAPGKGWVVQSWFASFLYGAADRWWGPGGLVVLIGLTATVVGLLVWKLTQPAQSLLARLLIMAPILAIGIDAGWVERPLLFGLLALELLLLAAEGRLDPRWLAPVMWFWVNSHGSFPLGLLAVALLALGRYLDGQSPTTEMAALKWAGIGTLVASINPLGPRLLVFPLELLRRQDVLSNVLEWQSPKFVHIGQRAFLVEVVIAIVLVARRPAWRTALPLAVFTAAALLGTRNIVVAGTVLVPGLAFSLAGISDVIGAERRPIFRPVMAAIALIGALAVVVSTQGPVYGFNGYPVAAVTWAERNHLLAPGTHVVSRDYVGNYLEVRYGTTVKVFLDDRYDLFPASLVDDFTLLNNGRTGWNDVLDKYRTSAVLWPANEALAQLLADSPRWRVVYTDQEFLIAVPRDL
jgi:hypothetical protein